MQVNRAIFVYNIYLMSISDLVSDQAKKYQILVLKVCSMINCPKVYTFISYPILSYSKEFQPDVLSTFCARQV